MTIHFHPSQARLAAYAVGELEFGPSLIMSVHIEACAVCRTAVEHLEEVQGKSLEALPDADLGPQIFNNILAAIEQPKASLAPPPVAAIDGFELPKVIEHIGFRAPIHLTADAWIAHVDEPRHGDWRTYLFSAPAGTALPEHGHSGEELIVVLDGAFTDGRDFEAGDFAENGPEFSHWMRVTPHGRCIALISSAGAITWKRGDEHIGVALDI